MNGPAAALSMAITSILASAAGFVWMYLLPPLSVGTPLKFVLGSLGPIFVSRVKPDQYQGSLGVSFGLVVLGTLIGLAGIVLSRRRIPAIIATIVGLVMLLAVMFPFFVGGD